MSDDKNYEALRYHLTEKQGELARERAENEKLLKDKEETEGELQRTEDQVERLLRENDELREKNRALEVKVESLEKQLKQEQATRDRLQRERDQSCEMGISRSDLETELASYVVKCRKLESSLMLALDQLALTKERLSLVEKRLSKMEKTATDMAEIKTIVQKILKQTLSTTDSRKHEDELESGIELSDVLPGHSRTISLLQAQATSSTPPAYKEDYAVVPGSLHLEHSTESQIPSQHQPFQFGSELKSITKSFNRGMTISEQPVQENETSAYDLRKQYSDS